MTDTTLKILIDGLIPMAGAVGAITAAITAIATLRRQNVSDNRADGKLNNLTEKAAEIHTLTNSNLSELTKSYQILVEKSSGQDREIAGLKADKKDEAARVDRSAATAAALAIPATDEKIVNGGKAQPAQADRIEATGDDSNLRVRKVETVLGDRVEKVEEKLEEKLDEKKDK